MVLVDGECDNACLKVNNVGAGEGSGGRMFPLRARLRSRLAGRPRRGLEGVIDESPEGNGALADVNELLAFIALVRSSRA